MMVVVPGTVYMLHFSEPVRGASHYVGFTRLNPTARLLQHRAGKGAQLTRLAATRGVEMFLARVWPNETGAFERKLKKDSHFGEKCPVCISMKLAEEFKSAGLIAGVRGGLPGEPG